jgi:hypothetical protein
MRLLRSLAFPFATLVAAIAVLWAIVALHFDFPFAKHMAPWIFAILVAVVVVFVKGSRRKLVGVFGAFTLVLVWWLTLKPTNDAAWLPDVAELAWAAVNGDEVTLHNVRNGEYRTETEHPTTGNAKYSPLADHYICG